MRRRWRAFVAAMRAELAAVRARDEADRARLGRPHPPDFSQEDIRRRLAFLDAEVDALAGEHEEG